MSSLETDFLEEDSWSGPRYLFFSIQVKTTPPHTTPMRWFEIGLLDRLQTWRKPAELSQGRSPRLKWKQKEAAPPSTLVLCCSGNTHSLAYFHLQAQGARGPETRCSEKDLQVPLCRGGGFPTKGMADAKPSTRRPGRRSYAHSKAQIAFFNH